MSIQFVQIPLREWKRIVQILDRFDKEYTPKSLWVEAGPFSKATGKTKEQLRYFRGKHPELVRPKANSPLYQYDLTGYKRLYQ